MRSVRKKYVEMDLAEQASVGRPCMPRISPEFVMVETISVPIVLRSMPNNVVSYLIKYYGAPTMLDILNKRSWTQVGRGLIGRY